MKLAVEGCLHGELDLLYDTIRSGKESSFPDCVLICGDFQAVRNLQDLACMNCPDKYKKMNDFYKYFSGERKALVKTITIGGNHEASNYMQELSFGGYLAQDIYFLGKAGAVLVKTNESPTTFRIAGISGIFNERGSYKDQYEKPPYNNSTIRSIYHTRSLVLLQMSIYSYYLKKFNCTVDVFLTHDWPKNIEKFGNLEELLRKKPFFRPDIDKSDFGNPLTEPLLDILRPGFWFSAHMHVYFKAVVEHTNKSRTVFIALDKCLPRRRFLEYIDLPSSSSEKSCTEKEENLTEFLYDKYWLATLVSCKTFLSPIAKVPILNLDEFTQESIFQWVSESDLHTSLKFVEDRFKDDFRIPAFDKSNYMHVDVYTQNLEERTASNKNFFFESNKFSRQVTQLGNPQTDYLLQKLNLNHSGITIPANSFSLGDSNEINVDN